MAFLGPIGFKVLVGVLVVGLVLALYLRWRGAQRAIGAAIEVTEQKAHNAAIRKVQDNVEVADHNDIDALFDGA